MSLLEKFVKELKESFEVIGHTRAYTEVKKLVEEIKETELEIAALQGMVENLKKGKTELEKELLQKKLKELEAERKKLAKLKKEVEMIMEVLKSV